MTDETPKNPPRPVPPVQPTHPTQPAGPPPTQVVGGPPPHGPGPGAPWAPAPTPEPAPNEPRRRPTMLIVGVVALVAVLVVGFVFILNGGDDDTTSNPADPAAIPDPTTVTDTPINTAVDEPQSTETPTTTIAPPATATELARSVVQILALSEDGVCTGSGTIIDESGLILTNSHVITRSEVCPWDELLVATVDTPDLPPQVLFEGVVVADDPMLDLAAVRISARLDGEPVVPNFPAIEIGDSASLELGEGLSILGFPGIGGETITFTEGTISGFIEQPGLGVRSWVKTDASIAGGNSGGLAADEQGRIVGVPSRAGTGDAEDITDCRLVADTNGDGQIDGADSCIPIGGFINGIRPIDAAGPIIAEGLASDVPAPTPPTTAPPTTAPPTTAPPTTAPPTTAPAPDTTFALNPRFSIQTTNGLPDPEVFVVADGATQLCLTWQYANFPVGASFDLGWTIDGVFDGGSFTQGTNQGGASGEFFGCINNDAGLVPGRYEVGWAVNGIPIFNHAIYVGGGRVPLTIGLQNNTPDPICFVSWAPVGTPGTGLLRNTATVNPGERFETILASGRYATSVADCEGNVIFTDPDTEFASDLTLTLPL